MRLGKLCPEVFKAIKKVLKAREKAITTELAWRIHQRSQGERPKGSFIKAVRCLEHAT